MKFLKTCLRVLIAGGTIASGLVILTALRRSQKSSPATYTYSPLVTNAQTVSSTNTVIPKEDKVSKTAVSSSPQKQTEKESTSEQEYFKGFLVETGAKGGKYYINENGKKVYIKDKDKDLIQKSKK